MDVDLGIAGIVDVETTGFAAGTDEVVEFGLVLFSFSRERGRIVEVVDEYCGLREPSRPIPWGAVRVHGITTETVRGMRLDRPRVEQMLVRTEFLVAHNAGFDRSFVAPLFNACAQKPWCCSMRGIDWKGRGFSSRSLQNLLREHGITVTRAHRAADDARAVLELLAQRADYFPELLVSGRVAGTVLRAGGRPGAGDSEREAAAGLALLQD